MVRGILAFVVTLMAAGMAQAASVAPPPPPVEDYGKLPAMDLVTLSPSGQRYAYVGVIEGKRRLVIATTANQILKAADLGSAKVERLDWAGDEHVLIHRSATVDLGPAFLSTRWELGAVTVVDLAHGKVFSVFDGAGNRVADTVFGSYGTAQIGGRWYGFFGGYTFEKVVGGQTLNNRREGELFPDLYRVDLDTGETHLDTHGQPGIAGWVVAASGEAAAKVVFDQQSGDWRVAGANVTGKTLASGHSPTGAISVLGFGHSDRQILVRVAGEDHDLIQELPLEGSAAAAASYDADQFGRRLVDPVTRTWIGAEAEDDHHSVTMFAASAQAKVDAAVKPFAGYMTRVVSQSADLNHVIVFTDGGDDSGTYWIVDITSLKATPLGLAYPSVPPEQTASVQWVDYKAADGLAMRGVLTLPPGRTAKALPLVVMPHGGPEAHDSLRFDYWAQAFATRGYAVFQPNFRGSSGSGNAFRDAGFGQWGRKMQTDISDGATELARRGIVDPKRACIVGWNYGGYAALAGVTVQQGLYRCSVSYGGVSDLAAMLDAPLTGAGRFNAEGRYWRRFMGVNSTFDLEAGSISPAHLAARADAPVLLIHGKDDTVAPIEQSQEMEAALRRAGKPVEFITLPGADHWLFEEDSRVAMLKASVEFVLKNNPPDPAPAAAGPN